MPIIQIGRKCVIDTDTILLCRFVREAVSDSSLPEGGVAKVEWCFREGLLDYRQMSTYGNTDKDIVNSSYQIPWEYQISWERGQ